MITLSLNEEFSAPLESIYFGEIVASPDIKDMMIGEPMQLFGKTDVAMRELSIHLEGDGADSVQLAMEGGVWADTGQSILISEEEIPADSTFTFWARAVYKPGNAEGRLPLNLRFKGIALG